MFAAANEEYFLRYNEQVDVGTLPMFSRLHLANHNGECEKTLYVAIRGLIFDVSDNAKHYGPGKSYHVLVGKDCTRLLGLNKLKLPQEKLELGWLTDTTWYSEDFTVKQHEVVDKWILFFKKRYRVVGIVVDYQPRV